MGYVGFRTHLLTIDPNFLGHPSRLTSTKREDVGLDPKNIPSKHRTPGRAWKTRDKVTRRAPKNQFEMV